MTSSAPSLPGLRCSLHHADALFELLQRDHILGLFDFNTRSRADVHDDPRYLHVPLRPFGKPVVEIWHSSDPVVHGRDHGISWAKNGTLLFGSIEIDEGSGGIATAAAEAYACLNGFLTRHGYPCLWRIWNYMDAITCGTGDNERYRQFCIGRAKGMKRIDTTTLPAATAIGRRDGMRRLQVYWLAARSPGSPLENPRQISAYHYPRQYGAQPPSFARAMLPPATSAMPLILSGTAAIVGHASQHHDCVSAQLDEIFANFGSLAAIARQHRPSLPDIFGPDDLLKIYIRDEEDWPTVAARLNAHIDARIPRILLHADICRTELRVEIEGILGTPSPAHHAHMSLTGMCAYHPTG
ncbi:MAG: pteridine-dependent deoxygenase [Xanthomonadaceae bacterium]|jgi:chorismate lyase/3-hydroxybenzoate synthase|nr:pteridine-dependent deoxygenase [Xanthomonadaceae bacterium]